MEIENNRIGILIVDDEFLKSEGLFDLYQEIGDRVAAARGKQLKFYKGTNGQEGIELFRQHHPKLVISDYQMPIMDGLNFLKTIAPELNSSHFNLATSCQDEGLDKEVERLGGRFYLKPLSVSILKQMYQEVMPQDNQ